MKYLKLILRWTLLLPIFLAAWFSITIVWWLLDEHDPLLHQGIRDDFRDKFLTL